VAGSSGLQVYIGATSADLAKGLEDAKRQIEGWAREATRGLGTAGASAKAAGREFGSLGESVKAFARDQRSEARAVSFFVGELSQIVPVSGSAKMAISGIGQAFVGGAGIASMVGLAVAAVGALALAFRNAREESEGINREIIKLESKLSVIRMTVAGGSIAGAKTQLDHEIDAKMAEIRALNRDLDEKRSSVVRFMPGEAVVEEKLRKAMLELELIRAEGEAKLTELERREAEKRAQIAEEEQRRKVKATKDAYDARLEDARFRAREGEGYGISEDANLLGGPAKIQGATQAQKALNAEVARSIDLQKQWGQALGSTFAQFLTGQITAKQALASLLATAIRQIGANAAVTATEGAKAVAGVPIIGPALAITTMAELFAAVIAMQGQVGSAAGGYRVPDWVGSAGAPTMLHGGEHVLPKSIARNYEGGGRRGGGLTMNLYGAGDARDVRRMLEEELPRVYRRLQRQGAL